jgi:hypothetical protein
MMKFIHFWLKCCIWLDWWNSYIFGWNAAYGWIDEIHTLLVEMLHMVGWWNSCIFGWSAYGWIDENSYIFGWNAYDWMIKLICFFLEMYIVGRWTPHTSFYLNKAKKYTWKKGRKKGVGGGGLWAIKIQQPYIIKGRR